MRDIIWKYCNSAEFCYPSYFFYINKSTTKEMFQEHKIKTVGLVVLFYLAATIACLGYYVLLPLRLLHMWCEEWCFH